MFNKFIGAGRLTSDPNFSMTQSGTAVCKFTIACDRKFKGQNGEKQADFISCVAWRQTAEFVSRYFNKGSAIIVDGVLQNDNYTDQNGVKHYGMVVNVESVSFCGSKNESNGSQNAPQQPQYNQGGSYNPTPQNGITGQQNGSQAALGDLGDFEDILSDGDTPF